MGRDLRTAAALGIEPVISSLAGACLPLLVAFRMAESPNTRIATTAIPSRVGRLGVSQGTTKKCPIVEHRSPRRRNFRLKGSGNWKFTMLVPNSLLEIGGLIRDSTGAAVCNHAPRRLHVRPVRSILSNALNFRPYASKTAFRATHQPKAGKSRQSLPRNCR